MTQAQIQDWLQSYVARLLKAQPAAVDVELSFERLGLDSASAVALIGDLEDWLHLEIDPVAAYDFPTIAKLSAFLAELAANRSLVA